MRENTDHEKLQTQILFTQCLLNILDQVFDGAFCNNSYRLGYSSRNLHLYVKLNIYFKSLLNASISYYTSQKVFLLDFLDFWCIWNLHLMLYHGHFILYLLRVFLKVFFSKAQWKNIKAPIAHWSIKNWHYCIVVILLVYWHILLLQFT